MCYVNMNIFQSIFLGIVQGITEFLPISSSAHLIITREFLHWQDPGIAFDVMLHLGTLLGVVWFFWDRWMKMLKSVLLKKTGEEARLNKKLFWMIIAATIPAGVAGYFFNDYVESALRSPIIAGWTMIIFGLVLYAGDKKTSFCHPEERVERSPEKRSFGTSGTSNDRVPPETLAVAQGSLAKSAINISWLKSIIIGFSQALALIPGVSRSGATMTAGLFSGLDRKTAAEFSFLLSAPIIFGAGIKEIPDLAKSGGLNLSAFFGFLAAAISGFLAVRFLIRHLEKGSFLPFVIYRILLGFVILGIFI